MDDLYIPFNRPSITNDEISAVVDCLRSGWITTGPLVRQFEKEFAAFIGAKHAIAVNSCTAAVHLSLKALGIGEGDEVITTPMTFVSTPNDIIEVGATPIFVDINPITHNIDENKIEEKITKNTKAIIPVHIAGHPCEMDKIKELADKYNLAIIEDAAHALPALYKDKKIGTIGDTTCFSFYATKNLCTSEGGMVTTDDDEVARQIRIYTLHGISKDAYNRYSNGGDWYYEVVVPGFKYNMPDIMAAMGLVQLNRLAEMQERRKEIVQQYTKGFSQIEELELPIAYDHVSSAWHLYIIKLKLEKLKITRNEFVERLKERQIGVSVHFIPVHYFPYYRDTYQLQKGCFPICESVFDRIISLPLYPDLKDSEIARVIDAVKQTVSEGKK